MKVVQPSDVEPIWLSILIPAYNVENYVRACLESTRSQPLEGVEILVLDDCSTDRTAREIESFCREYPAIPIRLLRHDVNRGLSAARNTLLAHSRGEWIWFLDSDDVLWPGACAALRDTIGAHAPDLIITGYKTIDERPHRSSRRKVRYRTAFRGPANRPLTRSDSILEGVLKSGKWYAWNKVARRELWDGLAFPEGLYFEDMACVPELLLRAKRAVFMPHPCVGYRHRPGSILQTASEKKIRDHFWAAGRASAACRHHRTRLSWSGRFALARHVVNNRLDAIRQLLALPTPPSKPELCDLRKQLLMALPCSAEEFYLCALLRLRWREAVALWQFLASTKFCAPA